MNKTFTEFWKSLNLKHFEAWEVERFHQRPGNSEPPRELWRNIILTAVVVDTAREELGQPISLSSVYRNPIYNRPPFNKGGKRSQHLVFTAMDCHPRGDLTPRQLFDYLRAQRGRWYAMPFDFADFFRFLEHPLPGQPPIPSRHLAWRRDEGVFYVKFAGGLGLYSWGVHVDSRGINTTWGLNP